MFFIIWLSVFALLAIVSIFFIGMESHKKSDDTPVLMILFFLSSIWPVVIGLAPFFGIYYLGAYVSRPKEATSENTEIPKMSDLELTKKQLEQVQVQLEQIKFENAELLRKLNQSIYK